MLLVSTVSKVTQISEEDEDSFDSYDAEAVKEISPTHETIFDSEMTNLVCPVSAKETQKVMLEFYEENHQQSTVMSVFSGKWGIILQVLERYPLNLGEISRKEAFRNRYKNHDHRTTFPVS